MSIDLKNIAGNVAEVTVTFGGQSAKVSYYPSKITVGAMEALDDKGSGQDDQIAFLCGVIKSWDIKEGGKKIPVTPAGLRKVPAVVLRGIFRAIQEDTGDVGEA